MVSMHLVVWPSSVSNPGRTKARASGKAASTYRSRRWRVASRSRITCSWSGKWGSKPAQAAVERSIPIKATFAEPLASCGLRYHHLGLASRNSMTAWYLGASFTGWPGYSIKPYEPHLE